MCDCVRCMQCVCAYGMRVLVCMFVCACMRVCVCVYIYIYIYIYVTRSEKSRLPRTQQQDTLFTIKQ